jgi:predicted DNA-binding ribbon-helix-helix protein
MSRTKSGPRQRRMATTITLPTATWDRLLKMASERASSVSRVVEQLVEKEDAHDANRDQNG